ncbi:MAG: (2Fe-2S)-binding protein [Acidobacteria bacterium]|nr:(2Fe-2S)-binding protein [Acidobacteriota bacterium]
MPSTITIFVNSKPVPATPETTVAAALLNAGITTFRHSPRHEPRSPLCGMGICMECRVTIDGVPGLRSCQTLCREGMQVQLEVEPA